MAMKKDEGREFVKEAGGLHLPQPGRCDRRQTPRPRSRPSRPCARPSTSWATWSANIINNLNGNHVVVTADHGFLFTETPPGETDKSKLDDKPAGTVLAKKRYLLGHNLPDNEAAWHGYTAVTARAEGDMEFWIPKGANRFHFVGGARFVHGGAMLQEIVVPVVTRAARQGQVGTGDEDQARAVPCSVLGTNTRSRPTATASS